MAWLYEHADVVTAVSNVGVLIVWMVYAQFFYKSYRRQRRPRIIVDQMSGFGPASACVITNLSSEPVYLECVLVAACTDDREFVGPITDQDQASLGQSERELISLMRQGPLATGHLIAVGTIEDLARRALSYCGEGEAVMRRLQSVEVRVVATMSSEDNAFGVLKRFNVCFEQGHERSTAARLGTHQMLSRRDKRKVMRWVGSV